jgi:hypothetical protein
MFENCDSNLRQKALEAKKNIAIACMQSSGLVEVTKIRGNFWRTTGFISIIISFWYLYISSNP